MAYTPLRISIPEPCHEDWNGMTPVDGTTARHCDSCAKNVVDFTGFTDAQLHAYTKENGARICGRFRPDQLGRPLRATHKPSYQPLKVAAAAAGLVLSSASCDAQSFPDDNRVGEIAVAIKNVDTVPTPSTPVQLPDSLRPQVMGKIAMPAPATEPEAIECTVIRMDGMVAEQPIYPEDLIDVVSPTGDSIPEVIDYQIPLVETDIHSEETITGALIIKNYPIATFDVIQSHGTQGQTLIKEQIDGLPVKTDSVPGQGPIDRYEDQPMIMGLMIVEPPKPTGMDWFVDTIKNLGNGSDPAPKIETPHQRPRPEIPTYLTDFTLSPNPMSEKVRLTIVAPEATVLELSILDATGQQLYSQTWPVVTGENQLTLRPKLRKRDGIVFVRLTDGNGLRETKALIVR